MRIIADNVLNKILEEIREAKFFSISVDSTPDISHVDQLTFTIRYVSKTGPVERFLSFIPMESHKGKDIAQIIFDFLEKNKLDIKNCRGQSYDNASNMSEKYNGVQAQILKSCIYALYLPCMAHSLNLVGQCAVENCKEATELFSLIQSIYVFYSASTHRWSKQCNALENSDKGLPVVKRYSDTRWSARHDAVKALTSGYEEHVALLKEFSDDPDYNPSTRAEATGLLNQLTKLETCILLSFWNNVLERVEKTNKKLQEEGLSLNLALHMLNSLLEYVSNLRENFNEFEEVGKQCSNEHYSEKNKRPRKRKRFFDEEEDYDTNNFSSSDKFKTEVYIPIVDNLIVALKKRISAYTLLDSRFGFLANLSSLSTNDLRESANKLIKNYPEDLEECFANELVHFVALLKSLKAENSDKTFTDNEMYDIIHTNDLKQAFPNVEICLRLYLCLFVTNCKGERSFSKLKLIKNYLRNTMGQERLTCLSLLSIESNVLRQINVTEIIDQFSAEKSRRKYI
jgi:hypothetical protein